MRISHWSFFIFFFMNKTLTKRKTLVPLTLDIKSLLKNKTIHITGVHYVSFKKTLSFDNDYRNYLYE